MSEYSYNPLVFNSVESAAFNAANSLYDGSVYALHYLLLPGAYAGYQGAKWAFSRGNRNPVQAGVVVAGGPAPAQGLIRRLLDKSTQWLRSGIKQASRVVVPAVLSDFSYQSWMKDNVWDAMKPVVTAFMRPMLQKMIPHIYNAFDKNDLNFSLREFVPSGEGSVLTTVNRPLWYLRNGLSKLLFTHRLSQLAAPNAYVLGESVTDTTIAVAETAKDIFWGASQIGRHIIGGPRKTLQGIQEIHQYFGNQLDCISRASEPLRTAAAEWASWGVVQFKDGMHQGYELIQDGMMYMAEGISNGLESKTGVKIPANAIYYMEVAAATAVGGALGYLASKGAWMRLNNWFMGHPLPPFVINNRLYTLLFGGAAAGQMPVNGPVPVNNPVAPQVVGPVVGGP